MVQLVERADGDLFAFDAEPRDAGSLELLYTRAREDEWLEFVRECEKYEAELDHEEEIGKFTPAELDEEEQILERLRRWFRELRARDVFGAPSAPEAEPPTRAALPAVPVPGGEWVRLRRHATMRIEESLDHIPTVLHRLGLFLLIGSFAMVAFCIAVVIVLIHAVA